MVCPLHRLYFVAFTGCTIGMPDEIANIVFIAASLLHVVRQRLW